MKNMKKSKLNISKLYQYICYAFLIGAAIGGFGMIYYLTR
jgi:hypothetical protein